MLTFIFIDPSHTHTYTLSLHDALPISHTQEIQASSPKDHRDVRPDRNLQLAPPRCAHDDLGAADRDAACGRVGHRDRSEEHTSELQSRQYLVCRLLLEKKKIKQKTY